MKKIYLLFFLVCILIFPCVTNADVCSDAKKDAEKLEYKFELFLEEGVFPKYKTTLKNFTKNLGVLEPTNQQNTTGVFTVDGAGSYYTQDISIYDRNFTCSEPVRILKLEVPLYNEYSEMTICEDIMDYKYCQPVIYEKVTLSEVLDNIKNFRNEMINREQIENKDYEETPYIDKEKQEKKKVEEKKKQSIKNYIIGGVSAFLLICFVVIFIIYLRKRKKMVV